MVRWKNMDKYIFRKTSYSKTCILELQTLHHVVECFFPLPPLYKCLNLFFSHTIICVMRNTYSSTLKLLFLFYKYKKFSKSAWSATQIHTKYTPLTSNYIMTIVPFTQVLFSSIFLRVYRGSLKR